MPEILASQRAMLERQGKKAEDETMLAQAYQAQLSGLEEWLRAYGEQFATLPIAYREIIENSNAAAVRVDNFLGGGLKVEAMVKAVDPTLYRQRLPK